MEKDLITILQSNNKEEEFDEEDEEVGVCCSYGYAGEYSVCVRACRSPGTAIHLRTLHKEVLP